MNHPNKKRKYGNCIYAYRVICNREYTYPGCWLILYASRIIFNGEITNKKKSPMCTCIFFRYIILLMILTENSPLDYILSVTLGWYRNDKSFVYHVTYSIYVLWWKIFQKTGSIPSSYIRLSSLFIFNFPSFIQWFFSLSNLFFVLISKLLIIS